MTTPHPLTPDAIEEAVSADYERRLPWIHLTRHDTAVTSNTTDLHGPREPFDLWESVRAVA